MMIQINYYLKYFFFILFVSTPGLNSYSQIRSTVQIDLSGSFFTNEVFRFSEIDGAGYADDGEGLRFGIQFNRMISKKLWINTGLGYFQTVNVVHGAYQGPMEAQIIQTHKAGLVQVPFRLRYDLLKWLYIKSGLTFDYQVRYKGVNKVDDQSGIGFSCAPGINLRLSESLRINIEPELGITSLIPFKGDTYQQHFLMTGVNVNLGYSL